MIEQAKGMLMLIYGLDADAAFDLLKWRSQKSNVKLRRLAKNSSTNFARFATRPSALGSRLMMCCCRTEYRGPRRDDAAHPAAN